MTAVVIFSGVMFAVALVVSMLLLAVGDQSEEGKR